MNAIDTFATGPMWAGFLILVLATLAVDVFALGGRHAHRVSPREALCWTLVWAILAGLFGVALWWFLDDTAGREVASRKVPGRGLGSVTRCGGRPTTDHCAAQSRRKSLIRHTPAG